MSLIQLSFITENVAPANSAEIVRQTGIGYGETVRIKCGLRQERVVNIRCI